MTFTELALTRLKPPRQGQRVYWDTGTKGQLGLSVLVSAGGTKTYRATFQLEGQHISVKLGRVGELDLAEAREKTLDYRKQAAQGKDPRKPAKDPAKVLYEDVVGQFIEHYAKPRQRTWDQTERVLRNCTSLLGKRIDQINKHDVRTLLRGYVAEGHPYKAAVARAWLKKLWRWAAEEDYVTSPIMEAVSLNYQKRKRDDWVFSDDEIKATWRAADKLSPVEGAYIKLMILLAPRKTALACLRKSHLDDPDNPAVWVTPLQLTKSRKTTDKRQYLTPLPGLAQRIIKRLLKGDDDRLFPGFPVHETEGGQPTFYGVDLKRKLIEQGAPASFRYHAWRHTIATRLQSNHSEWEIGMILNHASSSVTAGYSHGYPLDLKRKLLEEWAAHVESLVQPGEGVAVLR